MQRLHHALLIPVLGLSVRASAQATPAPAGHSLRGIVRTVTGVPVGGANVFLLETLEGALSDSAGQFTIRTSEHGIVTLVARHIGFRPETRLIPGDTAGVVELALTPQAAALSAITVQAGAYRADDQRGAALTSLDVARTPGATADVARAMQTLPGVQSVDEGTGLFVRGGDVSETRVLLNDAVMLSPYNYETPTGNFTVTVNPFLLEGIFFSSGGFGARYGNVLSGIADLRTQGRPARTSVTGVAGLASVSTAFDFALPHGLGAHVTAARNDLRYLLKLNGSRRSYDPAPRGGDVSASAIWNYRPTGEIKSFAIDRTNAIGITVDDPSFTGGYASDVHSTMVQGGWKDLFGAFAPMISVSYAGVRRDEGYGVFELGNKEHWSQLFTQTAWSPREQYTVRVGGDLDWRDARFIGSLPESFTDRGPGARSTVFDSKANGGRNGAFGEVDWRAFENLRVITGLRTDYSSFTGTRTVDPRVSAAYKPFEGATFTAAWGDYHQVSDPLYFASGLGDATLAPMHARQSVLGAQVGSDKQVFRVELYDKRYDNLVALTRAKDVKGGGTGFARGADVFLRGKVNSWISGRISYSYVDAQRTDPNTGTRARAPWDVTNSLAVIADHDLPRGWSVSGALRYATGKPVTPVSGATFDAQRSVWTPIYGPAYSDRLPDMRRVDLSLSRFTRLSGQTVLVYFFSVNNLFDRVNVYQYSYNANYTQRVTVPSLFNRSFYVGGSITHLTAQ